jgi:hypothetical protein
MSQFIRMLGIYFAQLDSLTPNQAQSYRADQFIGGQYRGTDFIGGFFKGLGNGMEYPYAMLMSNQDQSSAGITSENLITYNTPVFESGIYVENNSRLRFQYSGQYLIAFNLQVANHAVAVKEFEVWLKDSGTNVALSNRKYDIPIQKTGSVWGHTVPSVTFIFTVTDPETDYLEIAWWSDSTDVYLEHYAAGTNPTRPEIPSVILTANFVSALPTAFIFPPPDNLVISGAAPNISRGVPRTPPAGSLVLTGIAPTVTIA